MNLGKAVNVGSKATGSAMAKATQVSRGTTRRTTVTAPRRRIHPGSAAGLDNAKSVRINLEGSGYLNPANQKARNSRTTIPKVAPSVMPDGFMPRNRTFDLRPLKSSSGSVHKLREML